MIKTSPYFSSPKYSKNMIPNHIKTIKEKTKHRYYKKWSITHQLQEHKLCQAVFQYRKKPHVFWSWKCDHTYSLGAFKNTNLWFSVRVAMHYWIQIQPSSKGRTTTFKEIRTLPAEILLISQTRSPSRSPPKAKTKGKSGQQAAQNRTPWQGGRKKKEFFF